MTNENAEEHETYQHQHEENRRTYSLISGVANHTFDGSPEKTRNSISKGLQIGIGRDILGHVGRDEVGIGQALLGRAGSDEETNPRGVKVMEGQADENNNNPSEEDKEYWRPSYMFRW